jgi:hypothetical protein
MNLQGPGFRLPPVVDGDFFVFLTKIACGECPTLRHALYNVVDELDRAGKMIPLLSEDDIDGLLAHCMDLEGDEFSHEWGEELHCLEYQGYPSPTTARSVPLILEVLSRSTKEKPMTNINNLLSGMGGSKLLDRFFRRADNVVWDLMSGSIGFKTRDGIVTIEGEGEDAVPSINPIDGFGMELPAFAQQTAIEQVKMGDMILQGDKVGWVVELKGKSIRLLRPNGDRTLFTPPKTKILDFGSGVMVVRSLINTLPGGAGQLGGLQGMLLPMMMMGGDGMDMEKMLPLLLMSQGAGTAADGTPNPFGAMGAAGGGNMMQMMLMMQMMKGMGGKDSARSDDGYGRPSSPFNTGRGRG